MSKTVEERLKTLECHHPMQSRILRTEGPEKASQGVQYYVWEYCSACSTTLRTYYVQQGTIPEDWKVNTCGRRS